MYIYSEPDRGKIHTCNQSLTRHFPWLFGIKFNLKQGLPTNLWHCIQIHLFGYSRSRNTCKKGGRQSLGWWWENKYSLFIKPPQPIKPVKTSGSKFCAFFDLKEVDNHATTLLKMLSGGGASSPEKHSFHLTTEYLPYLPAELSSSGS